MKKRNLTLLRPLLGVLVALVLGTVIYFTGENESPKATPSDPSSQEDASFELTFIDVGAGDSALLVCDGEAMLIDAGDSEHGDAVADCLKEHGITELKYVVATHPHADHIGGMKKALKKVDTVTNFLMPNAYNNTATYEKLLDYLEEREIGITVPEIGDTFSVGSAVFTVLSQQDHTYTDDLNDYSIVLMATYANRRILLSGDTGVEPQNEMMLAFDLACDVYKVAHHGSYYNNSAVWLDALSPAYAVISADGVSNKHPSESTLSLLAEREVTVYRTDKAGNVTLSITPSGKMIFHTEK